MSEGCVEGRSAVGGDAFEVGLLVVVDSRPDEVDKQGAGLSTVEEYSG